MRRLAVLSVVLSFFFNVAAQAATVDDAKAFTHSLGDKAIAIMKEEGKPVDAKIKKVQDLFSNTVDIEWVSKFVLGRYWKEATDQQKKDYMKNYHDFLLKHYTEKFTEYTNESFNITNAREDSPGSFTLRMEIVRPGQESVVVDYRLHAKGSDFKIFDIIVEGVSLITTQRSEFSSIVQRQGLDYLIDQLGKKSADVASN